MRFVLADDSFAFDGYSPSSQPMGGPEKSFAAIAGALAQRGHEVLVFNRTSYGLEAEGAKWEPLDKDKPAECDAMVALRLPRPSSGGARKKRSRPSGPAADPLGRMRAHSTRQGAHDG
jgi:hypothetical protein